MVKTETRPTNPKIPKMAMKSKIPKTATTT
jgi:hypothetical protein